jgi:hypothetical protein
MHRKASKGVHNNVMVSIMKPFISQCKMNINVNGENSSLHKQLRPLKNGYLPLVKGLSDNTVFSYFLWTVFVNFVFSFCT